jgi:hypothetical protein
MTDPTRIGIKVINNASDSEIAVGPIPSWVNKMLSIVIFAGASLGVFVAFSDFVFAKNHEAAIAALVFIPFALIFFLGAALQLGWVFSGAQVITRKEDIITVAKKIGSKTIGKKRTYSIGGIENVRAENDSYRYRGNNVVRYKIFFDYVGEKKLILELLKKEQIDFLMSGPLNELLKT